MQKCVCMCFSWSGYLIEVFSEPFKDSDNLSGVS